MATLVYSEAGGNSTHYQLRGKSILIGASAECAIRSGDPLLAPQHARLFERDGEYWIEDLGSSAGVFVGNERISQSRVAFGQTIVVGSLLLRLDQGSDIEHEPAPLDPAELVGMLAAAGERQRQLEEERNALGARLGELHQEFAEVKAALEAATPASEETVPLGSALGASLDALAGELRAAESARRELEAKINHAQRRRARTQSEIDTAAADSMGGDLAEVEIKQVQLLALQAQMAEADKTVERLRGQLTRRNREIAELRSKTLSPDDGDLANDVDVDVESDGDDGSAAGANKNGSVKTTKPYAVPQVADPNSPADRRLAELKARFEAQFSRAVTLQRRLKTAESRLAEAESAAQAATASAAEADRLKASAAALESTNAALAAELAAAKEQLAKAPPAADASEASTLKSKVDDLKKLLEGAQRESSSLRSKLTAAKDEAKTSSVRARALETELAQSAAKVIEQAEKLVTVGARLEEKTAEVESKDGELTDMAAAVAISAERQVDQGVLEGQIANLQSDLEKVRGSIKKSEEARDLALSARRELEARVISARSEADESTAKLDHAERRVNEAQAARAGAERALETAQKELIAAREARLAAEESLAELAAPDNGDNTAVISLKRRISENQEEAAAEIERLTGRLREVETDLDRALDAEQAALARADAEASAIAAQIDRLTEERDKLAAARGELGDQLKVERDARAELQSQLAGRAERVRDLERELAAATAEAAASEASHASSEATAELRSRVVELASQNAKLSGEASAGDERAGAQAARIAELEAALEIARIETTTAQSRFDDAEVDRTRSYEQIAQRQTAAESARADSQASQLEELLRECQTLRLRVAELEAEVSLGDYFDTTGASDRIETSSDFEEFTAPSGPPGALIEWMNSLHEAIADLRRQMRAASDEAAVMDGDSASLDIVNSALSAAVERVEAARDALSKVAKLVGIN